MADLMDLVGGRAAQQAQQVKARGRITRAYMSGLELGMREEQQAQNQAFRAVQTQKMLADLQAKGRFNENAGAWIEYISNPENDLSTPEGKRIVANAFKLDRQLFLQTMDDREMWRRLNLKQEHDIANEKLVPSLEEASEAVRAGQAAGLIDPADLVGKTWSFAQAAIKSAADTARARERQAAIGQRHLDKHQLNLEKHALNQWQAQVELAHKEVDSDYVAAQTELILFKIARGGYETLGDWQRDQVPFFERIMTKGAVPRRNATQEETVVAEAAAVLSWNLMENGMTAGEALGKVMEKYDIKPTEKRVVRGDIRTPAEPALEDIRKGGGADDVGRDMLNALQEIFREQNQE